MYYLAVCNNDGICYGFLKKDGGISTDPDNEKDLLEMFRKKSEANKKCLQINLGHMLLPDGALFRVAVVKD